jgi:hypothetical protein
VQSWTLPCHSVGLSFPICAMVIAVIPAHRKGLRYLLALRFSNHIPKFWVSPLGQRGHCGGLEMMDTHWMLTLFMSWVPLP